MRIGYESGGDDFATVTATDGSTQSLTVGDGVTISAGVLYHPKAAVTLEATLGYKFKQVNYSNGSVEATRIPLDVIFSLGNAVGFRVGVGATAHFSPTFSCNLTNICQGDVSLDTAYGGIVQMAYGFGLGPNSGLEIGIRYTLISYSGSGITNTSNGTNSLDGSCAGLFVSSWL